MTSLPPRTWGLPEPNDDPVYVELRKRAVRLLWNHGRQGLDSKFMDVGKFHLGMFTGDGDPYLVSVAVNSPAPTRARYNILSDSDGSFNRGACEECLLLLRPMQVLDDLADA